MEGKHWGPTVIRQELENFNNNVYKIFTLTCYTLKNSNKKFKLS